MQLAEINIAYLRYPLDDPRVAEFVDNLGAINALAEQSPGFVWRLKDEAVGNATHIRAFDDPLIIANMSVWSSVEALYEFTYKTMHRRFVQRRQEWFELFGAAYLALWWIENGASPGVAEGRRRLAHLERFGPTAYAFNFRRLFEPDADARPLADQAEPPSDPTRYRLCG
jgi:hypothetical protein